jgi:hypothetical protein
VLLYEEQGLLVQIALRAEFLFYKITFKKVKLSRYKPWWHIGGEEV